MNNFDFLKPVDKNLFDVISKAESLYRDEYFEQSIVQSRKFAENVCKKVLGVSRTTEKTFDDMLATLKDKATSSIQEKEFIDDLYFIKREGNNSAHSTEVKNQGMVALECLQRCFEVAINYSVYYCKAKNSLLKKRYDTELLITGKKSKQSLAEKYEIEKAKNKANFKNKTISKKKAVKNKIVKENKKRFSITWFLWGISLIISIVLVLTMFLLSLV